jgi:hypothetical protein
MAICGNEFHMKKMIILQALLFTAGCSTYSKKECQQMDWRNQGVKYAMEGRTLDQGRSHFHETCERDHEIAFDVQSFESGYQDGLKNFCSPDNGARFGAKGGVYAGICPADSEPQFLAKYHSGREGYLEKKVHELKEENARLSREVSNLEDDLREAKSAARDCK